MKKLYILLLFACIVAPLLVEYWLPVPSGKGDWLSFWGSYLGIIPSGLIAYFVAKYQIDREHKNAKEEQDREYLPYFSIKVESLFFNSLKESLPIRDLDGILYYKESGEQSVEKAILFPNEMHGLQKYYANILHVDIACRLLNGLEVFYTNGEGVDGAHFVKWPNGNIEQYVFEKTEDANKLAWDRLKKSRFDISL
ncbi:hypothetical protein RU86_GL000558 [Lactococcus piscium]|uniref:Uncharacterized protein n=1 Tax=Pseudolactococcus piscium TaxID=1364 RepID=A0A2A5RX54_9LACT|nr:hypothetical protein [Lactococcus piscium]PCS05803.1 hypothetical protein RU86_GL000558 [Lactococcus piscium]